MAIEKIEKMPDGNYRIVDVEVRSRPYLLSLRQQLQGLTAQAAQVAARAKELDPSNTPLATWADRLQASIQEKKAS